MIQHIRIKAGKYPLNLLSSSEIEAIGLSVYKQKD